MTAAEWKIEVRDGVRQRVGLLDDFQKLELKLRLNDISTWQLQISRRHRLAPYLSQEGAGIIVTRNDVPMLSGFWTDEDEDGASDPGTLTYTGVDDTAWLADRLAYPDPNDVVPPYAALNDARSGVASTIIRQYIDENGGLATPIVRRIPGLFADAVVDPVVGGASLGAGRWQSVLSLVQEIATAAESNTTPIGFRIIQSGTDLLLDLYPCEDKTATVRFSREHGNLAGYKRKRTRPKSNYAIVGGPGTGAARVMYEVGNSASIAAWGRIENDLVDASNSDTVSELDQDGRKALLDGGEQTSLSITAIDLEDQAFGEDYFLGTKVTAVLDSLGPLDDVVTATAFAQGAAVTGGYLVALENDGLPFPTGTRVRVRRSDGMLKERGNRVVTGRTTAFGFTNIDFFPPLDGPGTDVGDYLEAFVAAPTTGTQVQDLVREVAVTLTDAGESITPSIGTGDARINPSRVLPTLRKLGGRLTNLERK